MYVFLYLIARADSSTSAPPQKYPEVFKSDASLPVKPFSLEHFHIQGSRILSRSFSVPSSRAGRKRPTRQEAGDVSMQTDGDISMQTDQGDKTLDLGDQTTETVNEDDEPEEEEESDDEDEDAEEEVMVPVADMLNAAYERDNVRLQLELDILARSLIRPSRSQARLFHEDDCLKMVTTKAIAKGEQIVRNVCNRTTVNLD